MSFLSRTSKTNLTKSEVSFSIAQIDCSLQVSKRRRSIGFKVHNGHITLQIPYGLPIALLQSAVAARRAWLLAKQTQQLAMPKTPTRRLESGESWPYFGENLQLEIVTGQSHCIQAADHQLLMQLTRRQKSLACRQRLLEAWYKTQALEFARQRVAYWQQAMAVDLKKRQATGIQVRSYRSRWGSCSSHGELKFNWLLAMAPKSVFDYVVVHEMCHLRYMHHGPDFWRLVERYNPDYPAAKQWLRDNAHSLVMNPAA